MSLIENERTKLSAAWLNTVAAGAIVTGAIAPAVAAIYGISGPSQMSFGALALGSILWLLAGIALHFVARTMLKRLKP